MNKQKNVLIAGGSGTIGKALSKKLVQHGYQVAVLSRVKKNSSGLKTYFWDLEKQFLEDEAVLECDYLLNLAGANIGEKRWSDQRKKLLLDSRIKTTNFLFNKFQQLGKKPEAFISASAVGYYGAVTSEKIFDEKDPPANDFLGSVCSRWESECDAFENSGVRTVKIRTGVVLNNGEGALQKMMLPIKMFVGSPLGSGKQYLPWIHIDDLSNIYIKALEDERITGAYNAVAPEYITNKDFMKTLAEIMNKPFFLPNVPSFLLKLIFNEMSCIILAGSRISSEKILNSGYTFLFPNLKDALTSLLKKE
ncbi:MAG: TIGR01777 family oxidoreductase [Ignavibacteriaceae bacterium]|nr:TIGR01777 family oxidoreductase [Ignavibacteriaceae bacterium]